LTQKLILGLDIGTSSVRAALYDLDGIILPETFAKHERKLTVTDEGGVEIDAEKGFRQVTRAIDDVLERAANVPGDIVYVAACSFWHSLVGVDKKGKATTSVMSWADRRSRKYTDTLRKRIDEANAQKRTGARFHSSFWPAKLEWIRHESPAIFTRTDLWLSFSDFVALRLFGVAATSISMASGTGIFDIRSSAWDAKLLRSLKIRHGSLPLVAAGSYTFRLLDKFRKRRPRLREAEWFSAIGDGAANNIGSGCVKRAKAALMIGTSGAMRVAYTGDPPENIPAGLWCYRIDRRRVIIGGALSDGGGLYAWMKDRLRVGLSDDAIAREIARRGADAHSLTVMPFFAGERSTGYNEDATGAIIGLRSSHDAIDIIQAAMESVAFRFAEIFDQIKTVTPVKEIVVSGGALRSSPVWTQMLADVLGRDMHVLEADEASMRGAVLLALESLGKIENIQRVSTRTVRTKFHPECHKIYKVARKRHTTHYTTINPKT
jgi:gluconokinase